MKFKLIIKLAIEKVNIFGSRMQKLISNYEEIEKIMKLDKSINLKLIYFYKDIILY